MSARKGVPTETSNWRDTGCEIAPACLSCPLPRCRYDAPTRVLRINRNHVIRDARGVGESAESIATRLGVSRRTVFRAIGE